MLLISKRADQPVEQAIGSSRFLTRSPSGNASRTVSLHRHIFVPSRAAVRCTVRQSMTLRSANSCIVKPPVV